MAVHTMYLESSSPLFHSENGGFAYKNKDYWRCGPHISIVWPCYWCNLAAGCEGSGLYCVLSKLTFLDGRDTYAGDDSRILPDIRSANFQQHTINICNNPTSSEIHGRSRTAGTPYATVEMLAYNRHLSANGNAKTIFNTTGCMQIISCHECLAYMELIQNPI
jgi:hypothetical protein